jgi:hypothetical protein
MRPYNGVHPWLLKLNENQKRGEWLAALEKMPSLKPRTVVAGHKNPKNDDVGSRVIGQTREYILDFQQLSERTSSQREILRPNADPIPELAQSRCTLEFHDRNQEMTEDRKIAGLTAKPPECVRFVGFPSNRNQNPKVLPKSLAAAKQFTPAAPPSPLLARPQFSLNSSAASHFCIPSSTK